MNPLGSHLSILIGPTVPVPAPPQVVEAIDTIEVSHSDSERSAFQIVFRVGRSRFDLIDYSLLIGPLLQPFSRIVLLVTFNALPQVLMDGVITEQQLKPGNEPGSSILTVTGEDMSVLMDLEERSEEHPGQPEAVIALKILAQYATHGVIPTVIPPPTIDIPLITERTPVQQDTDLNYLTEMAERFAYTFFVSPGPAPFTSTGYWGPPPRVGALQRALSINMGSHTNVSDIDFRYDGLSPTFVSGSVQDRLTNTQLPVETAFSTRIPLAPLPGWATQSKTRTRRFRESGPSVIQAYAQAQAQVDSAADQTITASGSLNTEAYGSLLTPRGIVGLRGAGFSYDGVYYVKKVEHRIGSGSYSQNFTLTREGLGAITPVVVP